MLRPPYTVEKRGARTLIVPQRFAGSTFDVHPLCEVSPYNPREDAETTAVQIAARLNWHDELADALRDMVQLFHPGNKQPRTAGQMAVHARAAELLRNMGKR